MKNKNYPLLVAFPLFIGLSGCASMNGNMDDKTRTTVEGAAVGGLLGAIPCAFLKDKSLCALTVAGGAALGGLAGNYVGTLKGQSVSNETALDGEIQNTREFNQVVTQHNQQTQQELRTMEEQLNKLSLNKTNSQSTKATLAREHSKLVGLVANNNQMLKKLQAEYADKRDFLDKNRERTSSNQRLQSLNSETEMLSRNIQQLKDSNEQLAKMDNRLSM